MLGERQNTLVWLRAWAKRVGDEYKDDQEQEEWDAFKKRCVDDVWIEHTNLSAACRILRVQHRSRLRPLLHVRQSSTAERPAPQNIASRLGMAES